MSLDTPVQRQSSLSSSRHWLGVGMLLLGAMVVSGCDDDAERPEKITKLRAIGVSASRTAVEPSTAETPQVVTLTFLAAVPKGETVTAEAFRDEDSQYAIPLPVTIQQETAATNTTYAGLDIFSVSGTLVAPSAATPIPADPGFVALRYGIRLVAGAESETIVGNVILVPPGATQLSWAPLSVDVSAPTAGAVVSAGGESDLVATTVKGTEENVRVGWYVSSGKVKNRRARETKWEEPGQGTHTVIVTARGLRTGAFAWKAVDIAAQ